jgi:hypothetical protein
MAKSHIDFSDDSLYWGEGDEDKEESQTDHENTIPLLIIWYFKHDIFSHLYYKR